MPYRKPDCLKTPLIITTALTGNVPTKEMNPNVPCTSEEIAKDVKECYEAGSALFHIHARDEKTQKPTHDIEVFKKTVRLVKQDNPDVIVQLSTGARAGSDPQSRIDVVRLCPEMASYSTGSCNLASKVYENTPQLVKEMAHVFTETGVVPEIECFDAGHLATALHMIKLGKIPSPAHFNFVINTAGGIAGSMRGLNFMVDSLPEGSTWTVTPIGNMQFPIISAVIGMGGHVRVGLEDMIFMPDGSLASNKMMVEKVVRMAKELGREIATPDEARRILSIPRENIDRVLDYVHDKKELFPITPMTKGGNPMPWSFDKDVPARLRSPGLASPALAINEKCNELRQEGKTVYRAGFGESPFPVPEVVVEELKKNADKHAYYPTQGIPELREAAASYLRRELKIDAEAERIMVAPGAKILIQQVYQALDAEIIIPTPCWVTYYPNTVITGKKYTIVPTCREHNWKITPAEIKDLVAKDVAGSNKRRLLVLNYPHNPTGVTYSREELVALVDILREHQILVLSDEIYATFQQDGHKHCSLGEVYPEGTIVLNGMSKSYGAGGWRLAFASIPKPLSFLVGTLKMLASNSFSLASAPIQFAAVKAYCEGRDDSIAEYEEKTRNILATLGRKCYGIMTASKLVDATYPQSAYYMYVNFEPIRDILAAQGLKTGPEVMLALLEETGVAMLSGVAFEQPASYLTARYCYVDFNGKNALENYPVDGVVTDEWLEKNCSGPIIAARKISEWAAEKKREFEN